MYIAARRAILRKVEKRQSPESPGMASVTAAARSNIDRDDGNDPDGDGSRNNDDHGSVGGDDGHRTLTETITVTIPGAGPTTMTTTITEHTSSESSTFTSSSAGRTVTSGNLNLSSSSKHLSGGSIGGIVFAAIVGSVLLAGLFFFCRRRRYKRQNSRLDLLGNERSGGMTQFNNLIASRNLFASSTRPNLSDRESDANRDEENGSGNGHSEGHQSTATQFEHNMAGVGAGVINLREPSGLPQTQEDIGGTESVSPRNSRYGYYGSTNSRIPIVAPIPLALPLPARSSMMLADESKFPMPLAVTPGSPGGTASRGSTINSGKIMRESLSPSNASASGSSFVETDAGPVTIEEAQGVNGNGAGRKINLPPPPY